MDGLDFPDYAKSSNICRTDNYVKPNYVISVSLVAPNGTTKITAFLNFPESKYCWLAVAGVLSGFTHSCMDIGHFY